MSELKPCPFCCGKVELIRNSHREFAAGYNVACVKCSVTTREYKNENDAITIWNARADTEIDRLQQKNDEQYYKIIGVMQFVDKWLSGDDLKLSELDRAIKMREVTLNLVEKLERENEQLKAENYRLGLLDRQRCGGCGAPLCKDITLCKECVNKISEENTQLRELVRLAVEDIKRCECCQFIDSQPNCDCKCEKCKFDCKCNGCRDFSNFIWQHADKLKELEVEV